MAKNTLVINIDIRETRVALIENGIIAELHLERQSAKGTLGNVYLGKVSRVLPGMQAAFIDIGQERAAFLHVEDLIRPDDFEAYLAGRRKGPADEHTHVQIDESAIARPAVPVPAESSEGDATMIEHVPTSPHEVSEWAADLAEPVDDEVQAAEEERADAEAQAADADEGEDEAEAIEPDGEPEETAGEDASAEPIDDDAADDDESEEGEAATDEDARQVEAAAPVVGAALAAEGEAVLASATPTAEDEAQRAPRSRSRRGSRGRRRSGNTADRRKIPPPASAAPEPPPPRQGRSNREAPRAEGQRDHRRGRQNDRRGDGRGSDRRSKADPLRISKTTPIREVVREGQEVIVQVSKEPIGTKGARVTSHISLPGRYVVYLPTVEHIGISKRIGSEKERGRLREAIEAMKPPSGGLIVRTLAEGLTKKSLKADVGYLVRLWGEIARKRETAARAPEVLYTELDLVLKTARDLFTDDVAEIVIDDREEYIRLRRFVEMFMPERVDAIKLYDGEEPIFDAYGIEEEIGRALLRKVQLPSGGYLIIDQAEALTAIDVNTGRYVGKGSKDLEDTILATNLEAVDEIAYQLRFRNIGGLIILDLIDMDRAANREKVRRRLEQLLAKDNAKTTLNRISDLGLIEMTRKRTRESLGRLVNEPCFYCDGTGNLQSKQTIAYEILRQIKRDRLTLRGYRVVVNAHPAIVDLMKNEERGAVMEAEKIHRRRIDLVPRTDYHLERFDLSDK